MTSNLRNLYHRTLRDLYSLELQLISLAPEISGEISPETQRELELHQHQARTRRNHLENLAHRHGITICGNPCESMASLIGRSRSSLAQAEMSHLRDAITLALCDHIHHLVISGYTAARVFAHQLALPQDAEALTLLIEGSGSVAAPSSLRWAAGAHAGAAPAQPAPSAPRQSLPQAELLPA